ncbi:tripartite tricarboxylate transporter permease [Pararhizobium sp. IMCC21322]|uniref:tripartite tricarboxylate transporter permease n=1 Tax=Pararhizobium sp. IMCC21322 TaxID=3067903 RepID=UPI00274152A3|nr:tripartite tricarboxylate transporter permease [Pararhizobium sp. IMCC21322]
MYFESALAGLAMVVVWPAIGYLGLGIVLGMFFGAVPGLSGLVGMAILLPFTIGMDTASAFAFLIGMYAVTTTSDTLASVLLGVPGTAASQATILDGYPLAQKGEAARALGAAFTVSGIGGLLGAIMLALSIPIVEPLILAVSDPEFFVLGILGLTMVGALSGHSMLKGLTAACLGLLLATIGFAEFSGQPRYTFDFIYLLDGVPILPLVLGLFAIPEILDLAISDGSISRVKRTEVKGGMMTGVRDAFKHWWLGLRCTVIGVYIGMLPGLGGAIVDWVAYGHAVQSSKDKSQFGKGDIRGVIAPEAANNAMKGGALLPTIAFAIPGSASMAILLGAFTIQGLQPGPQMLISELDVTFSLIWSLAIANVAGALALLVWGNQLAKLTFVKGHILVPAVMQFIFMGSWIERSDMGDWILLLGFGALGYLMKKGGWSRPPLVLGYILGKIMESALHISIQTHSMGSFSRPIVLAMIALLILTLYVAYRRHKTNQLNTDPLEDSESEGGSVHHPSLSIPVSMGALLVFLAAGATALGWSYGSKLFPLTVIAVGIALALSVVLSDVRNLALMKRGANTALRPIVASEMGNAMKFVLLLLGVLLAALVVGQYLALIAFVGIYLWFWGRYSPRIIALYCALSAIGLYGLFEVVVPVIWYQPLFFTLF